MDVWTLKRLPSRTALLYHRKNPKLDLLLKPITRRSFVAALPAWAAVLVIRPASALVLRASAKHPAPRPGIDASKMLTRAELEGNAEALRIFDLVRQIPGVVDGIRCHCGCAEIPDYYSLLSCYEGDGMARYCEICSGEGELASRLHKQGKTLEQIRAEIDRKFT